MTPLQQKIAMAIVNIFETGQVQGRYGAVTLLKGDTGHLTYGRSQTTLGSGKLFQLLQIYCETPGAQFAEQIRPFLSRLAAKDISLDQDMTLRGTLHAAGDDPVMQTVQDSFFSANFFKPACSAAADCNIAKPLSQAVVYDSFIQGGWKVVRDRVNAKLGPVSDNVSEDAWIRAYVQTRKDWLSSLNDPLPKTVYRMDAFQQLMDKGGDQWDLALPLTVHGVNIAASAFDDEGGPPPVVVASAESNSFPVLHLTRPYTTGDDVRKLQQALASNGFANSADGVFGPFTEALVKQFQRSKGMDGDGVVGLNTAEALGLA